MYPFESYMLHIYESSKEYYSEIPEHRFIAYLREVPEASLYAYGSSQEEAISNLREQFDSLRKELEAEHKSLPDPKPNDTEEFSGRIVLRMPPWLHKLVDHLADDDGVSTNSYIVNSLIRKGTLDEVFNKMREEQQIMFHQWTHTLNRETKKSPELFLGLRHVQEQKTSQYKLKKVV